MSSTQRLRERRRTLSSPKLSREAGVNNPLPRLNLSKVERDNEFTLNASRSPTKSPPAQEWESQLAVLTSPRARRHDRTIEQLTEALQEREEEVLIAAQIGKALLQENSQLVMQLERLKKQEGFARFDLEEGATLESLHSENESLKMEVRVLRSQLIEASNSYSLLQNEINELKQKHTRSVELVRTKSTRTIRTQFDDIESFKKDLEVATKRAEELEKKNSKLKDENKEMAEELLVLKEELVELRNQVNRSVALKQNLEHQKKRNSLLIEKLELTEKLLEEKIEIEERVEEMKQSASATLVRSQSENSEKDQREALLELNDLKDKVNALETKNRRQGKEISNLHRQLEEASLELIKKDCEIDELQVENLEKKYHIEHLEDEIAKLRSELLAKEQQLPVVAAAESSDREGCPAAPTAVEETKPLPLVVDSAPPPPPSISSDQPLPSTPPLPSQPLKKVEIEEVKEPAETIPIPVSVPISYSLNEFERDLLGLINECLEHDNQVADKLPLNSDDFAATYRALYSCEVALRLMSLPENWGLDWRVVSRENVADNASLLRNTAISLGIPVNLVTPDLFQSNDIPKVMAFLAKLLELFLLEKITTRNFPQLKMLNKGSTSTSTPSSPSLLLSKWINFHLQKYQRSFSVAENGPVKFTLQKEDFGYLLLATCPEAADQFNEILQEKDAEKLVQMARKMGLKFISKEMLEKNNHEHNLIFLAYLFLKRPQVNLEIRKETSEEVTQGSSVALLSKEPEPIIISDEVSREEKVLLQWVGVLGVVGGAVNFEDVGDYMSILRLFHAVAPGSVDWKKVKEKPKNHFEQLEGCAYMLHVAKNMLKLQIVSFGAKDILQKNRKYILAILWQVMRYHMLQILKKLSKKGKEMTEQDLVQWANQKVESIGFPTKIASLKEKHLGDGIFLAHLVAALYPKHINLNLLYTNPATIKEKKENCVYVLSVARKIGCIVFLLWEDMLEVNQKMMFTFIATLYTHYAEHSTL